MEKQVVEVNEPEIQGWISIDTVNNGLTFGGTRFSPNVSEREVVMLSQAMTNKLCLHNLPTGGCKTGIKVNPKDPEIFEKLAVFAQKVKPYLEEFVIMGKDLGATDKIMESMYAAINIPQLSCVQKSRKNHQVPDKLNQLTGYIKHMTAKGVHIAIDEYFEGKLKGLRFIVQGAGVVGQGIVKRMIDSGAILLGINDHEKAWFAPDGIPLEHIPMHASQKELPDSTPSGVNLLQRDDLLKEKSDLMILAASSNCIDLPMARAFNSETVVEAANFPLQVPADNYLTTQGVNVLPDIIGNSSSAAMVTMQMNSGNSITSEDLWKSIEENIRYATKECKNLHEKNGNSLRSNLYENLIPRIKESIFSDSRRTAS